MSMDNEIDGDQIIFATGGYDHTIKLWQTHTGICQRTLQQPSSQVNALSITPDKAYLASASYEHVYMYELQATNPNPNIRYAGTSKNVTSIGFQEDGKWMYFGSEDCKARIWDLRSRDYKCPRIFEVAGPISVVRLHPNQVELFIGDHTGTIYRWDLRTDHDEQLIPDSDAMVLGMDINSIGTMLACVNNKGCCYVWNLTSGVNDEPTKMQPMIRFPVHKRHGLMCQFSPDSKYLVTTSSDQTAKIWATEDFQKTPKMQPIQELKHENRRWVWDAAFSSDSQYVFTASSDGLARLWNVKTGAFERQYAGHQKAVTALAFKDTAM